MSKTRSHFITRFSDFVSRRFRGHKSATKPPNTFVLSKRGKIKALMEVVQRYDVRANASPHALFMPKHSEKPGPVKYWIQRDLGQPKGKLEAIHSWFGFVIYCTPQDHPADPVYQTYREPNAWWGRLTSDPLTLMPYYPFVQLCKPALFLAQVGWDEIDEWADLNTLYLRTHIDELDQRPPNQPADLDWAVEKCNWLWSKALPNEPLPTCSITFSGEVAECGVFLSSFFLGFSTTKEVLRIEGTGTVTDEETSGELTTGYLSIDRGGAVP